MRISDWSSDVCSSDLRKTVLPASPQRRIIGPESVYHGALGDRTAAAFLGDLREGPFEPLEIGDLLPNALEMFDRQIGDLRSEEHTSELQSLMRISYAVFCLKKKIIESKLQQYNVQSTRVLNTSCR